MAVKRKLKSCTQAAAVLLLAFALKSFYSAASVNDLPWILGPTTLLVELITGSQFEFESQAGYMSTDHTFLIAAPCSGVNFLIISFLMLGLGKVWREWPRSIGWRFIPIAAVVAYLATLLANTTRIVVALSSQNLEVTWLDREELHRVEGILVYFGFLLLLFLASEKLAARGENVWTVATTIALRSRYLLLIYYGVTLGIPLARGSYYESDFWQHAPFVLLIPVALITPFAIFCIIRNRYRPQELPYAMGRRDRHYVAAPRSTRNRNAW